MTDTQSSFLNAMLPSVPFDGWSGSLFDKTAASLDISKEEARRLFPGGAADVLLFFIAEADRLVNEELQKPEIASLKIPQKIRHAILYRLNHFTPHREAVRRAAAFYALPMNGIDGAKSLMRTVDVIWRAAGDTSIDFSYYTRRATLGTIYSLTLIYWLDDHSENSRDTAEFLDRQLAGVKAFGDFKKRCSEALKRCADKAPLRRTWG